MAQHFRLLNEQQVHSLLPMTDLIAAMESALANFSAGEVLQPVRSVLTVGPTKAYFGLMPAYMPASPASLGAKLVTVFGDNHKKHLPSHLATILLLDPDTGALLAMMDGRYITEARTAAVSAVSARFLARADAATLAIIGSGVQARSHLEAYQHVRQLKDVRIWSPSAQSRQRFVDDMSPDVSDPDHRRRSAEAAMRGADLIVLVTSSPTPVIEMPGCPRARTWCASAPAARLSRKCRRSWSSAAGCTWIRATPPCWKSGDVVMNIADGLFDASHIRGEIGEVVLGRVAGRKARQRHHGLQVAWHGRGRRGRRGPGVSPGRRNPAPARSSRYERSAIRIADQDQKRAKWIADRS